MHIALNYINWAYIKLHEYGRAKLEFSLQKKKKKLIYDGF